MKNYIILIIGMTIVTYLPRFLPLISLTEQRLPPLLNKFLYYIPYTALGALIVRVVSNSNPDTKVAAIVGLSAAAACSYLKGGMILSALVSIITSFLFLKFF